MIALIVLESIEFLFFQLISGYTLQLNKISTLCKNKFIFHIFNSNNSSFFNVNSTYFFHFYIMEFKQRNVYSWIFMYNN